jgi:proteasome lid subunit RPN8/RPN11
LVVINFEKDIKILIAREIYKEMVYCVDSVTPNEACGLLFGLIIEEKKCQTENDFIYFYKAEEFDCIKSDRQSSVSFLIENIENLNRRIMQLVMSSNHERKMQIISIFHSHPSGNNPSLTDKAHMRYLNDFSNTQYTSKAFKNLIWTIMDAKNHAIQGYLYLNGQFLRVEVIIQ